MKSTEAELRRQLQAYLTEHRYTDSIRLLDQLMPLLEMPVDELYLKAVCQIRLGQYTAAASTLNRLTKLADTTLHADAWMLWAHCHYMTHNHLMAEPLLHSATAHADQLRNHTPYQAWLNYGIVCQELAAQHAAIDVQAYYLKAEAAFRQAIRLNHEPVEPYFHLAGVYLALQNYPEAIATYTVLIEGNENQPHPMIVKAFMGLALAYIHSQDLPRATACIRQAIRLNPMVRDVFLQDPAFESIHQADF
jgi:tetratricopeptide (TPR) repeat protein